MRREDDSRVKRFWGNEKDKLKEKWNDVGETCNLTDAGKKAGIIAEGSFLAVYGSCFTPYWYFLDCCDKV